MTIRVPKTRDRLAELAQLGLGQPPQEAHEVVEAAVEFGPPEPTALVHGDLHLRHLLVDDDSQPSAVIDWADLSYNSPGVDLVLYWSVLTAQGRVEFREAYGTISEDQLLCARILALFLCGTLALYAHHEGMPALRREALLGLDRTASVRLILDLKSTAKERSPRPKGGSNRPVPRSAWRACPRSRSSKPFRRRRRRGRGQSGAGSRAPPSRGARSTSRSRCGP